MLICSRCSSHDKVKIELYHKMLLLVERKVSVDCILHSHISLENVEKRMPTPLGDFVFVEYHIKIPSDADKALYSRNITDCGLDSIEAAKLHVC